MCDSQNCPFVLQKEKPALKTQAVYVLAIVRWQSFAGVALRNFC